MAKIISIKAEDAPETPGAAAALGAFLQKNRKPLLIGLLVAVGGVICLIAGFAFADASYSRGISSVEAFAERYEAIRFDIQESANAAEADALLGELQAFAEKKGGYPGARAFNLIAQLQFDRKNWAEAEAAWLASAEKNLKSYLAPVGFFNAAVAAEEAGKIDEAIAHYETVMGYSGDFSEAPRAQFSLGRLQETKGDREAALEAYRLTAEEFPANPWANLANSRIIALQGADG